MKYRSERLSSTVGFLLFTSVVVLVVVACSRRGLGCEVGCADHVPLCASFVWIAVALAFKTASSKDTWNGKSANQDGTLSLVSYRIFHGHIYTTHIAQASAAMRWYHDS